MRHDGSNDAPPMQDIERLAQFQATLLELLSQQLAPQEIMQRLRSEAAFAPYQDYVATFEPHMVEVAALLVKKWARRSNAPE